MTNKKDHTVRKILKSNRNHRRLSYEVTDTMLDLDKERPYANSTPALEEDGSMFDQFQ